MSTTSAGSLTAERPAIRTEHRVRGRTLKKAFGSCLLPIVPSGSAMIARISAFVNHRADSSSLSRSSRIVCAGSARPKQPTMRLALR